MIDADDVRVSQASRAYMQARAAMSPAYRMAMLAVIFSLSPALLKDATKVAHARKKFSGRLIISLARGQPTAIATPEAGDICLFAGLNAEGF